MSDTPSKADRRGYYRSILRITGYHSGHKKPVASEPTVRRICVDQLEMPQDRYNKVLAATQENDDLVGGSGWLWHPEESGAQTDAIEYVIEHSDDPHEFVAAMNRYSD